MVDSSSCPALLLERIPIDLIYTSPHQMRRIFDPEALKELACSMEQEGLIQPITVRKVGNAFELIVGERRLRAARMLQWRAIEARIIEISDEDAAVKGLIENLQRADLSPIEEAKGYKQLVGPPYNLTQEAVAQRVGKGQTAIARALALLDLPQEIQELMPHGIVTESHTRSIRKIPDRAKQVALARRAHREGWTVKETERQVEALLGALGHPIKVRETKVSLSADDPMQKMWQHVLQSSGESQVQVSAVRYKKKGKWSLEIEAKNTANPRRSLADFFMRLGHTLNAPVPPAPNAKPRQ